MISSKSFLSIAAAIGIFVFGGDKIYRLWRDEQNARMAQEQAFAKRKVMDKYWIERIMDIYKNRSDNSFNARIWNEVISSMREDGYNHAEIMLIAQEAARRDVSNYAKTYKG